MDNGYKISLGVSIDKNSLSSVQTQINGIESNLDPIKIIIDETHIKTQINNIKNQIENLGGSKGKNNIGSININTESLEKDLKDVTLLIKDIKNSIGTLDSGKGMNSLLSSINKISSALDKASGKFDELNAGLNALASKDFSINLGIKMGGGNQFQRNANYSKFVNNQIIPQLEQQINSLVGAYKKNLVGKNGGNMEALISLASGTSIFNDGDFFELLTSKNKKVNLLDRMSENNKDLKGRMEAYRQYIDLFQKAANLKGVDISGVTSGFSKTAKELIQDANDLRVGVNETEDNFEKLKQVFGGNNLNVEGISTQLDSIVTDLNEIKTAIQGLSSGTSLDTLVQSFNTLSETLRELTNNFILVRNNINTSLSGAGSSVSNMASQFREVDIKIGATEKQVTNLGNALKNVGFDKGAIDNITKDFDELGISVRNVTSRLHNDGSVTLTVKGIDQFERAVTVMRGVDSKGKITNLGTNISQSFDETQRAFERLKSIAQEMRQLDVRIAGLDDGKNQAEIFELMAQLQALEAEYNDLYAITSRNLSSTQLTTLEQECDKTVRKLTQVEAKISDTRAEAARDIKVKINNKDFTRSINDVNSRFNNLTTKTKELESAIRIVESIYKEMEVAAGTGEEVADVENLISANDRLENALKNVNNQLKIQENLNKQKAASEKLVDDRTLFQSKIDAWLTKNSAAAEQFGDRMRQLKALAENADRTELDHLQKEFKSLDKEAEAASVKMQKFTDRISTQFKKYSAYFSVASVFMYAKMALRDMFNEVVTIDTAMTELKKVTDETNASYNNFLTNAASKAKEIGATIDGLVKSTADFARLGYDFEESQELAEVANIYAVVGDEIDSVETATKSLISTFTAFKDENLEAIDIVDKFNEVGNNFAISSGGIGDALERSASSLAAANNTLDESIALITAANTVVQDPDSVGRLMPTLKMAISVKLQRWTRPRKGFISIFDIYQLGRIYVFI